MGFCKDAIWIQCPDFESPKFLKTFDISCKITEASLTVCGLGFFDVRINGQKITSDLLVPSWSDYEPRSDRRLLYPLNDSHTHRIYYLEYDVTKFLKPSENRIEVILGNGWYNQRCRNIEGDLWYDTPRLCFDIDVGGSQHIVSDESVLVSDSRIVFNNVYIGEEQDFRIKDNFIKMAERARIPDGIMQKQECPADRVHRIIYPNLVSTDGNKAIYDIGENTSGWAVFTQAGSEGDRTVVRYSEELSDDGAMDYNSAGGDSQIQTDVYVSDGSANVCRPKFTCHGFRYVEIEGNHDDLYIEVVYADVQVISEFECDNKIINSLYDNYIRSQLSNMHYGVPSDCPHRERLGYTGDGQLTCDCAMQMLSSEKFYRKWIQDICDCQDIHTGHIQHTAPFYGGGGGPGGWGSAIVIVPYYYYRNYGDKKLLKDTYPYMLKWCSYMDTRLKDGLISFEEEGGWCLGDWGGVSGEIKLPEAFVNTYFYIKALGFMLEIADVLNTEKEALFQRIKNLKAAMTKHYPVNDGKVLGDVGGAGAFLCDIGMGNREMLEKINEKYDALGEFDTSMFGTDVLIRVLFENGYADTAIKLLSSEKENSFGSQIKKGATTLWEYWNGGASHNHPMFGSCVKYLFGNLMGIQKQDGKILVKPNPSNQLKYVRGKLHGIEFSYKTDSSEIVFEISSESPYSFIYGDFYTEADGKNVYRFNWNQGGQYGKSNS